MRSSLAAQLLGFVAFTAVAQIQTLVRELISHTPHGMAREKRKRKVEGSAFSYSCLLLCSGDRSIISEIR